MSLNSFSYAFEYSNRSSGDWQWPDTIPSPVLRDFNPPARPWLKGNRGVDLAYKIGRPVHAIAGGTVLFADSIAGIGSVSIDHGTVRSTYQPLYPIVTEEEYVTQGQVIGYLSAGRTICPRSCIHLGIIDNHTGDYKDPLSYLKPVKIRLYPSIPKSH